MIRINLLGGERKQAQEAPAFDLGQRLTVACSLILVAAVVGIGWWYWTLPERVGARRHRDRVARRPKRRACSRCSPRYRNSKQQRTQLQQRVQLIEQLRSGQSVPVQLLDHVSRSLPDMLWLTDMKQDGGSRHDSGAQHDAHRAL